MNAAANFGYGILAQATEAAAAVGAAPGEPEDLMHRLHLGETFQQTTTVGWLLLLAGLFAGVVAGKVVQAVLRRIGDGSERRGWRMRGMLFGSLASPVSLLIVTLGLAFGLSWIHISDGSELERFVTRMLWFLGILAIGWFLYNLVDLLDAALTDFTARTESKLDDQVVPLVRKTLRIFLVIVFVLFVAENVFGADITAWLAGLGIAGLAVSLAAQDSLKNLFGSITVLLDRPFHVGDRVIIDGHDGPVEEIGFRSTKLRKLSGELVTIPNSKVVDASVVNVQRRPSIPRIFSLTVTYDTPPEKVLQGVEIVRAILAGPEMVAGFNMEKQPPRVYFDGYNPDSLNIKIYYWFVPATDWWAYNEHAQLFNLTVLRAFNEAGIEFAFPTRTLLLGGDRKRPLRVGVQGDDEPMSR